MSSDSATLPSIRYEIENSSGRRSSKVSATCAPRIDCSTSPYPRGGEAHASVTRTHRGLGGGARRLLDEAVAEPLAPGRPRGLPAQIASRLRVRRAPPAGHHRDPDVADREACEPRGN